MAMSTLGSLVFRFALDQSELFVNNGVARLEKCFLYSADIVAGFSRVVEVSTRTPVTVPRDEWELVSVTCYGRTFSATDRSTEEALKFPDTSSLTSCAGLLSLANRPASLAARKAQAVCSGVSAVAKSASASFQGGLSGTSKPDVLAFAWNHFTSFTPTRQRLSQCVQAASRPDDGQERRFVLRPLRGNAEFAVVVKSEHGPLWIDQVGCPNFHGTHYMRVILEEPESLSETDCERLERSVSLADICATYADLHQVTTASSSPLGRQECAVHTGISGDGSEVVFARQSSDEPWSLQRYSCHHRAKTAPHQLEYLLRIQRRINQPDFARHVQFLQPYLNDQEIPECFGFRADQFSGLSFNRLCL